MVWICTSQQFYAGRGAVQNATVSPDPCERGRTTEPGRFGYDVFLFPVILRVISCITTDKLKTPRPRVDFDDGPLASILIPRPLPQLLYPAPLLNWSILPQLASLPYRPPGPQTAKDNHPGGRSIPCLSLTAGASTNLACPTKVPESCL